MMHDAPRQIDLFQTTADVNAPVAVDQVAMEARVRPRLLALLDELRNAERMPWNEERARVHATVFPQMAKWLPAAERDDLERAFQAEVARLGAG